jgi:low temperature requirement protein LtrA
MSETTSPVTRRPWHRLMGARDPHERPRSATPLELLFDLAFVVAIARAAVEMHHAIAEEHAVAGILGYLLVFFAIWWAWMNFTWFASAYDCDDVLYRVLTLVQMAGVLLLAVGVPAVFRDFDISLVVAGYVVMRIPMVVQWLRAAREDPERATTCRIYALGIAVLQVLWVGLVFVPTPWAYAGLVILIAGELAVPTWAELRGRPTTWHPEHIAERYGLLTLIVLGEVILGVTNAIAGAFETGFSLSLLALAAGGLLLVFGLWWTYFLGGDEEGLTSLRVALTWGYGHYFVFGAIAALGAGLEVAVDAEEHVAHIGAVGAAMSVAIPVAIVLIVLSSLRALVWSRETRNPVLIGVLAVLLLACGVLAGVVGVGVAVLLMGVVLSAGLATFIVLASRRVESATRADQESTHDR